MTIHAVLNSKHITCTNLLHTKQHTTGQAPEVPAQIKMVQLAADSFYMIQLIFPYAQAVINDKQSGNVQLVDVTID